MVILCADCKFVVLVTCKSRHIHGICLTLNTTLVEATIEANLEALNRCQCYAQTVVKTVVYLNLFVALAIYDDCISRYPISKLIGHRDTQVGAITKFVLVLE